MNTRTGKMRTPLFLYSLLLTIVFCTGCWDWRELDEIAIVKAVGIDVHKDGFEVTVQIINPREVELDMTGYEAPISTYSATGPTIIEAVRNLSNEMSREAYFSHLHIAVISEELASRGIAPAIDFFRRDHEMRSDFNFMISKHVPAKDVVGILTSLESVPANRFFQSLQTSEKTLGSSMMVTIDDIASALISNGKHPVITAVTLIGSPDKGKEKENVEEAEPSTILKLAGLALFHNDRLIGWLSEDEGKSYNFIQSNIKNTIISVPCQEGNIAVEFFSVNSHIDAIMHEDEPMITIDIQLTGNISDIECPLNVQNLNEFYKVEQDTETMIKKDIITLIEKAQNKYKADIFGFGKEVYRSLPRIWKQKSKNWDEHFEHIPVRVHVNVTLKHQSTLRKSLPFHLKEKEKRNHGENY